MRCALLFLALLAPAAARAQQTDEQLWLGVNATHRDGDTAVTIEAIGRFSDSAGGFSHSEIGGIASVTASKGVDVGFGYRHVEDFDHGRTLPNEERLRQVISVTLGRGFLTRWRFEERFNSQGDEVGLRLRPQLRFTHQIARNGLAVFAAHESYFNFNTTPWGQRAGHERMRHTVGLTVPLLPRISADIGYLNQYRFGRGSRDRMDHAATFVLAYGF